MAEKEVKKKNDLAADKLKVLAAAMDKIQKDYGKGAIMRMGDQSVDKNIPVIPSGSITLDAALGVGGYPKGRIIEIFGPESSGKTTLAIHAIAEAQKAAALDEVPVGAVIVYKDKIYVVGKQEKHGVLASYTLDGEMEDFLLDKNTDSFGFSSVTVVDDSLVVATSRKVSDNFSSPTLIQYDLDLKYKNDISYNSQYSGRFLKVVTDSNDDLVVLGRADEKKGKKVVHHSFIGKYRSDLTEAEVVPYYNEGDDYFTDIAFLDDNYLISGYSYYSSQGYLSKFLTYSEALEVLEVK